MFSPWGRVSYNKNAASTPSGTGKKDDEASSINSSKTIDLILSYVVSNEGEWLREALVEDIIGVIEDANVVVLR